MTPSARQILARLDALKNAAEEFAAREEKLNRDFQSRATALTTAFESAMQAHETELAERITETGAAQETDTARASARFEQRKVRLNDAHYAVRKRVMESVTHEEGRRKYKIQEGTLDAERRREAALVAGDPAPQNIFKKKKTTHTPPLS